jgi:uncharacterized protein (DUF2336 family)
MRIATLRRVTDLFLTNAGRYDSEQVALFDDVLMQMIGHIESKALAELGQRLAPVDGAPVEVIRQLANHDEIAVAGPVLKDSQQLSAPDLVRIAQSKGQGHLLAISRRSEIDETVTDVLVNRGDSEVARSVAVNAGARFSQQGFATLVKRAEQDDTLAELAGRRADMPPQLFEQLLSKATEAVKEKLMASLRPEVANEIARTLGKITRDLQPKVTKRDYSEAQHLIKLMRQNGKLNEATVLEFARANRVEEALVALSLLCATPVEVIDRLMNGNRVDALLIPCKAAELSWPTAKATIRLHPIHGAASDETFEAAKRDYLKLPVSAAQRILRFWQVRSSVDSKVPTSRLSA